MFFLLIVFTAAFACGPGSSLSAGSGVSTAKPTMKLAYSPPLSWTWNSPVGGGQSMNEDQAQNRINADIEFAVIKAVESYGFSTAGVTVENAVKADGPLTIAMGTACPPPATTPATPAGNAALKVITVEGFRRVRRAAAAESYLAVDGVVTYKCITGGQEPFNHTGVTIEITSPVALPLSSWDNIASKVWATLTNSAGVKFHGLIEVSE